MNKIINLIKQQGDDYGIINKIHLDVNIHMTQNINILLKKIKNGP